MQFLTEIGPDTFINTFVVNVKNDDGTINRNVDVANAIQNDIFKKLSGYVGRSTKRIPMFLTTSNFNSIKYGKALDEFKKRLGVCIAFLYTLEIIPCPIVPSLNYIINDVSGDCGCLIIA